MQVNFTGILKADIPNYNTIQIPIKNRFEKAKHVENVLNGIPDNTYKRNEQTNIILLAKRAISDYKEPRSGAKAKDEGIYRLTARDAIYYCTGTDIELAKNKKKELQASGLTPKQKSKEMEKFINDRKQQTSTGFILLNSTDGERYDIIGMGSSRPSNDTFNCDFVYL